MIGKMAAEDKKQQFLRSENDFYTMDMQMNNMDDDSNIN